MNHHQQPNSSWTWVKFSYVYRCPSEWTSCPSSCSARGDYNGVPPPAVAKLPTREIVNQMLSVAAMEQAANMEAKDKLGRWEFTGLSLGPAVSGKNWRATKYCPQVRVIRQNG